LSDTDTAIKQAELIIKLYEPRRELVMRSARSYIGGEFLPRSFEDFLAIMAAGEQHAAYVLFTDSRARWLKSSEQHGQDEHRRGLSTPRYKRCVTRSICEALRSG
jgi:hypothetical protein